MSGHDDRSSGTSRQYYPYGSLPESEQPTRKSRPTGSTPLRTHAAPASQPTFAAEVQPGILATSGPSSHSVAHYLSLGSQAAQQAYQRQTGGTNPRVQQPRPLSSARSHRQHQAEQALSTSRRQTQELKQRTQTWENREAVRRQWRDKGQEYWRSEPERHAIPDRQATPQRHWRKDPDRDKYFDLEGNANK